MRIGEFPLKSVVGAVLLAGLACSSGCAYSNRYHRIVTMDAQGELISSFVSKGPIWRRDGGYRFVALEHMTDNPRRLYRYPLGFKTFIKAPETVIYRVEPPAWYLEIEALEVADAAEEGEPLTPPVPVR